MKKQSFLIGAFLLAIGGFLARAIGALYKIPLANILGSNGMGVYYLIFPLYSLLLVLVSSGISIAVSNLVSFERAGNNKQNQTTIFKVAVGYVFLLSLVLSLVLVVFSKPISLLQGNSNATFGYFAIAPALIFASLISVVRAYFQGLENMIPTSLSNVIEQIVKLVFGLLLANMFLQKGVEFAVFGAILGVTISEFVAFVIIIINFLFYKSKRKCSTDAQEKLEVTTPNLTAKQAFTKILKFAMPATLSSLIIPITAFIDSFLVINILVSSGNSSVVATSLYGLNSGVVNTLVSLPVIFTIALSTAIVPNLSGLHAKNNSAEVGFKSSFFIKIAWLVALPCFVLLLLYAPDIVQILYSKGLTDRVINEFEFAYKMIMVASISVVYYAFLQTFTSILQSINKPLIPFASLFLALLVRIVLEVVLLKLPQINVFGVIIANVVFLTIATVSNLLYLRKFVTLKFDFLRLFAIPIFSVCIMGLICYLLKVFMFLKLLPIVYVVIGGGAGLIIYLLLLYVLKVFNKQELKLLPSIKKITKSKIR